MARSVKIRGKFWKEIRTNKKAFDKTPKVLSLFSGAGGLDIGFDVAGYEILGCVEINKRFL